MVKISIIIPVYNDSVYVTQCIQSVLNQTLKEIEIVCIDDGSTDDSARLIERMMQGEERIVLLQQRNQGPGIARNEGIRKAGKTAGKVNIVGGNQQRDASLA